MKYQRRVQVVEAMQWFQHGDSPFVRETTEEELREMGQHFGAYTPSSDPETSSMFNRSIRTHVRAELLDMSMVGVTVKYNSDSPKYVVWPGDYVIVDDEHYVLIRVYSPRDFAILYEPGSESFMDVEDTRLHLPLSVLDVRGNRVNRYITGFDPVTGEVESQVRVNKEPVIQGGSFRKRVEVYPSPLTWIHIETDEELQEAKAACST